MGDTWQRVKDSADEEWKFLLVQDMEEFFDLHHVPPPFNVLILCSRIHAHYASDGRVPLSHYSGRRGPLLSAADIKKKSKVAQHDLMRKLEAEEARSMDAQIANLYQKQAEAAERLEKLASSSTITQRAMQQMADAMAAQAEANTPSVVLGLPPSGSAARAGAPRAFMSQRGSSMAIGRGAMARSHSSTPR